MSARADDSAALRANRRIAPASPTPARGFSAPALRGPTMPERMRRMGTRFSAAWGRARGPLAVAMKVGSALAVAAFAVATFRVVERWARSAPQFEIRELSIEGESRLTEDEIRATAGIEVGDNVFSRSPDDVRRALIEHPWIGEVTVERRLPGAFSIRVAERRAALVLLLDDPYLVSDEGTLIERAAPGAGAELPILTGVDPEHFLGDQAFRTRVLLEAVTLLSEYEASGLAAREPLSELRVEPGDELTLFVGDDAMEVRLGAGPFRQKLDRLTQVLRELRERDARAAYVLLDNERSPGRVTVRLR